MNTKNKIILIILGLLLILVIGYFYKDSLKNSNENNSLDTATTTDSVQEAVLGYDEDGNLTIVPIDTSVEDLPTAPDLDKKIIFFNDFPETQKNKIVQDIKNIVSKLKKNPSSFENWIDLGLNRKAIGDYKGAAEAWEYASLIRPGSSLPFNNLGDLYHYYLKDYKKAEANFLKAIKVDESYTLSYINLFDLYNLSYKKDTNKAEVILLEGLKNLPNDINLAITLANYYEEQNNISKATEYYKKALEQAKAVNNTELSSQIQSKIDSL